MSYFYLTTAIDYTNGNPHIGHAYEKILSDVIARYQRLTGENVYFLTGVDQHGQKIQQTAQDQGLTPQALSNRHTQSFRQLWGNLNLSNDGWAETTAPLHKQCVQKILNQLHQQGQLYQKSHRGFYSIRQEQFITEKEQLSNGLFPSELGEVIEIEEENWYFKLSQHIPWLKDYLQRTSKAITPNFRLKEVLQALEKSTNTDLCISRPKSRLQWGIELPFDTNYVTYVWFDALINYLSFAGYLAESNTDLPSFDQLWPANLHVIGKDILVPSHSIYWLTMLHALGFSDHQMPQFLVHGWWNINGEKMSKSLGNIVDPKKLSESFGSETIRYYLMADIKTGYDSDFSLDRLISIYNSDLANDLGNLCNRTLNMVHRYLNGQFKLSSAKSDDPKDQALRDSLSHTQKDYQQAMNNFQISEALQAIKNHVAYCNSYIENSKPWVLGEKPSELPRLTPLLYHLCESLAHLSVLLSPILPKASLAIQSQLNAPFLSNLLLPSLKWGLLPATHYIHQPKPIFPRIQKEDS